jgi:hypothetical protein
MLINRHSLKPLAATDVETYTFRVCNDQVDRDGERFSLEILHDFADSLPGKGLLEAHEWGAPGVGMFYKAWVENLDGVNWVMAKCYLPRAAKDSADAITKIDSGIAKWVSIGFYAPRQVGVNGVQEYRRGLNGEKGESLECSLVFLGAQYQAGIVKSLQRRVLREHNGKSFGFVIPRGA